LFVLSARAVVANLFALRLATRPTNNNNKQTHYRDSRWAAAADPSAQLCLNEFGTLDSQHWQRFSDIVTGLRSNGAPLHCLGVQAHLGVGKATREMVWAR
jgi:GH35 family endo-1,4-beta-xylanase